MTRHLLAALLCWFVLAATSCGLFSPPYNPADYPCGTRARKCASGKCCWNDYDCGGDTPGCPAGMCCYNYSNDPLHNDMARKSVRQFTPSRR